MVRGGTIFLSHFHSEQRNHQKHMIPHIAVYLLIPIILILVNPFIHSFIHVLYLGRRNKARKLNTLVFENHRIATRGSGPEPLGYIPLPGL